MGSKTFKPHNSSSLEKVSNTNEESNRRSGKAFKPFFNPVDINDLKKIEGFKHILSNGFNFIQYRKDSVFHLSRELFEDLEGLHNRDTHTTPIKQIFSEIKHKYAEREKATWIIDFTKYNFAPYTIFEQLSHVRKTDNIGVCIRSHIEDIPVESLEYFDVLFFFDMSDKMLDKLRSFISIPHNYIEKLRTDTKLRGEPVMVFVNSKRIVSDDFPVFSTNPFIVSCNSSLVSVGSMNKESKHMSNNTFNNTFGAVGTVMQGDNNTINNMMPISELMQMKDHLQSYPQGIPDNVIKTVDMAVEEEKNGNSDKAQSYLKKVGDELIPISKKIGTSVLTKFLESFI